MYFFIFLSQEIGAHCFLTKCSDNGVSRSVKIVMNDFLKIEIFIYLLLAVLGLHCYVHFSLVLVSRGFFLPELHGLLIVLTSLVVEHRPWDTWALVAVVPGL